MVMGINGNAMCRGCGSVGQRIVAMLAVLVIAAGMQALFAPVAIADVFVPISGSGSTWSSNALDQWRRNVSNLYGITVNFSANGSTSGRQDFRNGLVDFAVSEIPYGLNDGGVTDFLPHGSSGICRSWPVERRSCTTSRSAIGG
jgi:PBP superfamily domain